MPNDKPKCDDIGFAHAREHPPNGYYIAPGMQAQNETVRFCQNCGKRQYLTSKGTTQLNPSRYSAVAVFEWRDVE